MLFASRGNRNALRAQPSSAFFVSGRIKIFRIVIGLFICSLMASCDAGDDASHSSHGPSPGSSAPLEIQDTNRCLPFGSIETVDVARVYDGDTLSLSDGRKVRLVGINATEMGREGRQDQPFAQQARNAVDQFIGQSQRIELLLDAEKQDHYGRTLAHLYNQAGDNLEQYLLQRGLAYHVAIPPNLTLAECLAAAEQQARTAGKGLWSDQGLRPVAAEDIRRGGFQRVQGKVTAVSVGKHWRLALDNAIHVMVYAEHHHRFSPDWPSTVQGEIIEVQGWVYKTKGQWRIKLETPYGIELL